MWYRYSWSCFVPKQVTFLKFSGHRLNLLKCLFFFTFFWWPGSPSLLSEPMKTCFVGGNVTLTCQVSGAYPPAKILWLRNLTQPEVVIQPSGHHLITQSGQSSTLTIRNCSQDLDEGYYVCRAENAVGVREVDVWLSVKGKWWKWPWRSRVSEDQHGDSLLLPSCHCHQGGGISAYRWLNKRDGKLLSSPKSLTVVSK